MIFRSSSINKLIGGISKGLAKTFEVIWEFIEGCFEAILELIAPIIVFSFIGGFIWLIVETKISNGERDAKATAIINSIANQNVNVDSSIVGHIKLTPVLADQKGCDSMRISINSVRENAGVDIDSEKYDCVNVSNINLKTPEMIDVLNVLEINEFIETSARSHYRIEKAIFSMVAANPAITSEFIENSGLSIAIRVYDIPELEVAYVCFWKYRKETCDHFQHRSDPLDNIVINAELGKKVGVTYVSE